ncbi:stalk domain-containing protein [Clostridiaceae bacterium M8S5]|nr:stalk domain-containing protein [Clostridiaceae bacterium M8S5]
MKKTVSIVLLLVILTTMFLSSSFAGITDKMSIVVNGEVREMKYGTFPNKVNDIVYLPARDVFEIFNSKIVWNNKTKSVEVGLNNDKLELKIGSDEIKINSRPHTLESKVIIKDSRTMIPMSVLNAVGIDTYVNKQGNVSISLDIKQPEKVDVNVNYLGGPSAISLIKMLKDKPYLGKNVNVNYEMLKQVSLIQANMLNKKADFIVAPTNLGANIYNKTKGEYILADVYSWGVLYLSSTEEIKDFSGLKGKEIYLIGKTGTPGIVFNKLLQLNGLDPEKDVKLIYLSSPQELAMYMISGKAKTAVLPEPVQTQVLMKNKKVKVVMNIQEEWGKKYDSKLGFPQSSIFVKKEFLDAHRDIVKSFLREHKNSIKWVNENNAQAGLAGKELGIMPSEKIIEKSIPRCNLKYVDAKDAKAAVKEFLNTILSFNPKSIGGKLPDDGFYYENK